MPVDTEQMSQISLSDTINEWRVKYNSLVTAFNTMPSSASGAVTRLGGTIDGDNSGADVVEAELGTLIIRTSSRPAAGIGIGKFLGASEPTVPEAQLDVRTGSNSAIWLQTETASKYAALVLNNSSTLSVTEITQNSISVSNATALFADDTGIYHSGEIVANTLGVWANGATGFKIIAAGGGASHDLANSQGTFSPSTKGFILHNAKFVANQSHLVTEGKSVFSRTAGLYWDNDTKIATAADGILAPSAPGFNLLNANTVANSTGTYAPRYGGFHSQPTETVDGAATALFVANTKGVIAGGEIGFSLANKAFVANNLGIYGTFKGTVATTQADFEATNFFKITNDTFLANSTHLVANSIQVGPPVFPGGEYISAESSGTKAPIYIRKRPSAVSTLASTDPNSHPPAGVNRISLFGAGGVGGTETTWANTVGIGVSWNTPVGAQVATDIYGSRVRFFATNSGNKGTNETWSLDEKRLEANNLGLFANSHLGYSLDDGAFVANNMGIHLSNRLLANSTFGTYAFVNPGFRLTTGTRVANSTGTYADVSITGAGFKLLNADALLHDVANTIGTYADGGSGKNGFALIGGKFRANNKMVLSPRTTIDVVADTSISSGNNAPLRIIDRDPGPTDKLEPFGTNKISFGGPQYSNTIGIGTSYQPASISFDSYSYDTFRWFSRAGEDTFIRLDDAMLFANTRHGFVANSSNGFSIGNAAAPGLDAEGGRVFVANTSMVYAQQFITPIVNRGFVASMGGLEGRFSANNIEIGVSGAPSYPSISRLGNNAPIVIYTNTANVADPRLEQAGVNRIALLDRPVGFGTNSFANTIGFGVTTGTTAGHILDIYSAIAGIRMTSSSRKADGQAHTLSEVVLHANAAGTFVKPNWGKTAVLPIVANSAISNSTTSETDGANYGNANGSVTLLGNIKMWFDTRNVAGGSTSFDLSSEFIKIWTVQVTQANPAGTSRPPRARVQPDERSIAFQHGGSSPGPVYSILVIGESV